MIKLYAMLIVLVILAGVGYGGYSYYKDSQERIAVLRANNAKLEQAVETSQQSLALLKQEMIRFQELNTQLQNDLKKAEAYGDELRDKLRKHNLTELAKKKPKLLEGKMNGATAKLWRDLEQDTGGNGDTPLPHWLQQSEPTGLQRESGKGSPGSNENRKDNNTNSTEAKAG